MARLKANNEPPRETVREIYSTFRQHWLLRASSGEVTRRYIRGIEVATVSFLFFVCATNNGSQIEGKLARKATVFSDVEIP